MNVARGTAVGRWPQHQPLHVEAVGLGDARLEVEHAEADARRPQRAGGALCGQPGQHGRVALAAVGHVVGQALLPCIDQLARLGVGQGRGLVQRLRARRTRAAGAQQQGGRAQRDAVTAGQRPRPHGVCLAVRPTVSPSGGPSLRTTGADVRSAATS